MKVVLDTNVLIAAFATRGLCEAVLELCLENHEIVLSEPILREVREKLRAKLGVPEPLTRDTIEFLKNHSTMVEPTEVEENACRDPEDLMILGTAVAGGADYVVTGDRDLLSLEAYQRILILTPRAMWEREARGEAR